MDRMIGKEKLQGAIEGISSKSYAHRAIFCAALSKGASQLVINHLSKDIEASLRAVKAIGVEVKQEGSHYYICPPDQYTSPASIPVGESGTTLRLLLPILAALGIEAEVIRSGSLINRTNVVYFDSFPKHGVAISQQGPSIFLKGKLEDYHFSLPGNISSQFISGFLLASGIASQPAQIDITTAMESKPYIDMTIDVMAHFGVQVKQEGSTYTCQGPFQARYYQVEKDWSNALFFLASGVEVQGLNPDSKQGDRQALTFLQSLGYENMSQKDFHLVKRHPSQEEVSLDARDMPDTVPILCVLAGLCYTKTQVVHTKRLRLKESDRVLSTSQMLENLGVKVDVEEDSFSFTGVDHYQSCTVHAHNDHRIAMAASIAATFADGPVTVIDSHSVEKSYPGFFEDFKSLGGKVDVLWYGKKL